MRPAEIQLASRNEGFRQAIEKVQNCINREMKQYPSYGYSEQVAARMALQDLLWYVEELKP